MMQNFFPQFKLIDLVKINSICQSLQQNEFGAPSVEVGADIMRTSQGYLRLFRIIWGRDLCADVETVSSRTERRNICVQFANEECAWPRKKHGQFVAAERTRNIFGSFLAATRSMWNCRTLPGNCPEILCMIHRMLPGRQAGHHADCFVDANLAASWSAAWTSAGITKSPASRCGNHGADIHRRCVRRFPTTPRTLLGSCPAIARMIHPILRGLRRGLRR